MSKLICDVCGTQYPESAQQCPICGCANHANGAAEGLDEELVVPAPRERVRGGRFSAANVRKRNKNAAIQNDWQQNRFPVDEEEEEEVIFVAKPRKDRGNLILNILLVIVIVALLAVSAYLFVEHILPSITASETTPTTDPVVMDPTNGTDPTEDTGVPCTSLQIQDGVTIVELTEVGQAWLLNIVVVPENTTDTLIYTSSDDTVCTVNEQGRITAVGDGRAVIYANCGEQELEFFVVCSISEATEEPTDEPTEAPTAAPTEPLLDVTLKLNHEELTFRGKDQGVNLKCEGVPSKDITWTTDDPSIATVDENGKVISVGKGTTYIHAQYGTQKVSCKILCKF